MPQELGLLTSFDTVLRLYPTMIYVMRLSNKNFIFFSTLLILPMKLHRPFIEANYTNELFGMVDELTMFALL